MRGRGTRPGSTKKNKKIKCVNSVFTCSDPCHPNAPGLGQSWCARQAARQAAGRQQMEACQPLGDRLFCPTRTVKMKIKASFVGLLLPDIWHKVEDASLPEHLLPFVSSGGTNCEQFLFSLSLHRPRCPLQETNDKPTSGSRTRQTCRMHSPSFAVAASPAKAEVVSPPNCFTSPLLSPEDPGGKSQSFQ